MKTEKWKELEKEIEKFSEEYSRHPQKAVFSFLGRGGHLAVQEERRLLTAINRSRIAYSMGSNPAFLEMHGEVFDELNELRLLISSKVLAKVVEDIGEIGGESIDEQMQNLLRAASMR